MEEVFDSSILNMQTEQSRQRGVAKMREFDLRESKMRVICKGEKPNCPFSDLSKWNMEERLRASHSRKTKHNYFCM